MSQRRGADEPGSGADSADEETVLGRRRGGGPDEGAAEVDETVLRRRQSPVEHDTVIRPKPLGGAAAEYSEPDPTTADTVLRPRAGTVEPASPAPSASPAPAPEPPAAPPRTQPMQVVAARPPLPTAATPPPLAESWTRGAYRPGADGIDSVVYRPRTTVDGPEIPRRPVTDTASPAPAPRRRRRHRTGAVIAIVATAAVMIAAAALIVVLVTG